MFDWFRTEAPESTAVSEEAALARRRLQERKEVLQKHKEAGRSGPAPPAPPPPTPPPTAPFTSSSPETAAKGSFASEASVHEDPSTSSRPGRGKRSARSSSRYLSSTSRGSTRVSERLAAQTAREEERERQEKAAVMSARLSARNSARAASARFRRSPLPTTSTPSPEWRKWPDAPPGQRDVNSLWKQLNETRQASAAFSAIMREHREQAPGPNLGSPPQPQQQSEEPLYGSRRPLSAQERRFQLEKSMESKARRRLAELKAKERERLAIEELETKRRKHDRLRAKQQSARGLNKTERKASQQRLYAVSYTHLTLPTKA